MKRRAMLVRACVYDDGRGMERDCGRRHGAGVCRDDEMTSREGGAGGARAAPPSSDCAAAVQCPFACPCPALASSSRCRVRVRR